MYFLICTFTEAIKLFKTIKVVGVSGVGKTTLIKEFLSSNPEFKTLSYGWFLEQYGDHADNKWQEAIQQTNGTIIIDEHLEWGDRDFILLYKEERTVVIVLLIVTPDNLILRRVSDVSRKRPIDVEGVIKEQEITIERALYIAKELKIPLYVLYDATIEESLSVLKKAVSVAV